MVCLCELTAGARGVTVGCIPLVDTTSGLSVHDSLLLVWLLSDLGVLGVVTVPWCLVLCLLIFVHLNAVPCRSTAGCCVLLWVTSSCCCSYHAERVSAGGCCLLFGAFRHMLLCGFHSWYWKTAATAC
jgi:hypothetical protein